MRALRSSRDSSTDETTIVPQSGEREEGHCGELLSDFAIAVAAAVDVASLSSAFLLLSPSLHTFFFSPLYLL